MIRALIFDFDGLVMDTEGAIYQSYREIYHLYGCELSLERWALGIGTTDADYDPYDDLEAMLGRKLERAELKMQQRRREAELIEGRPALPGVRAYLADARWLGLKIGMASSSSCAWITGHLSRLDLLSYFDSMIGRDDVHMSKPDPAVYYAVLQALEVKPGEAIVFEDSPIGILAARRAGIFTVAVPNSLTRLLPMHEADLRLDSLADLPLEALMERVAAVKDGRRVAGIKGP